MDGPVINVPVDETLEALDHGRNWIQGHWSDENGICLHQGIRQCQYQPGDAHLIEQVAKRYGWGIDFNDDDRTTFDAVKSRLVEHREVFPDELEATFGPNWRQVVWLVRRAATLTTDEAKALAVVGAAAWAAAGAAAGAAARAAAWDAARAAAWDAARAAAWDAVGDAAWGAAAGIAIADLVGQHGLDQDHIDTLTGPWVSVIGPIPTNEELS